ncbi:MAG TPA: pitrilysin family protein, partial [Gemmatimonadaceae bacterium]|nr:pitrilysin family protein [Gemmatimonadaceae bacterium]
PAPPAAVRPPRPAPGAPRSYHFPRFERRRLGNGLRIVVAPIHKLPLVTVVVLVDAGAVADPLERDGVAQLTARLLLEGTTTSDGAALSDRFERLGATVEAHADWDVAAITVTALARNLAPAFELLGEVVRTPAFDTREVERLKAERLAELLQLRAEPRGLADELFARFVYEGASRYARPDGGDGRSVPVLSRGDVLAFYRARYAPGATTLVVAGDVTAHEVESLARATLGDWAGTAPAPARTTDAPARRSRAVHIVAKSDAPQSELRIGHVGLPRNHQDYFAAVVMNAVLGGLFSSRINLNLREAHGYTYGANSYFDWRRQSGPWLVSTAVQSDVTDAAAREALHEIERIRTAPIAADELSLATSYLDGVFPIRYETTAAIAAALANLVIYQLPDDWYDGYRERIRAVSAGDVLTAAQRHLHPDALQMVVVGNPAAVRAPLEALGFGPVTVYDTQGNPASV